MSDLQERLARLTPAKRAIFEKRLRGEAPSRPRAPEIPRRKVSAYPLLFDQEQLWVISQIDPTAYYLHISNAYRLRGALDVEALERAINEIVRRHENLRTTFVEVDGHPVPVIKPSLTLGLPKLDLSHVPEAEREAEMFRVLDRGICRPFDVSVGPLLRTALLRLSERDHVLLVVIHHIVVDRLSSDMFGREMAVLYDAFSKGRPSPLPELPIQYGDFALWQHQTLAGGVMEARLAYWREKLAGLPTLNLPTDYARKADQTYPGARHYWHLPAHLWEGLKRLSAEENVTRFVSFLALYGVLLSRHTGQEDFIVGSPINTRDRGEVLEIIGYFLNMLGLRLDLSGNPTFRELLRRARQVTLDTMAHRELSIIKIQQELRLNRNSIAPLYQVLYVYVNNDDEPAAQQLDLDIAALPIFYNSTPLVDVSFNVFDEEDDPRISFDYNTALFAPATIERMVGHLRTLLEAALADPDRRIADLPMLTPEERGRILSEWNDTAAAYAREACLQDLFEAQAARTPDTTAVVADDLRLSYGELNARANRLAHHLRRLGVGPEKLVGICAERSAEMLVGLLGVLKAGGAYLPLDPTYPRERLRFMLEDARVEVLLTQEHLSGIFAEPGPRQIYLDAGRDAFGSESTTNPPHAALPGNAAYVIYTSGSTGRPKGVQVPHGALVNFLGSFEREPGLAAGDTLLAVTSLSFDIAALELFLPLVVGARLVVVSREVAADGLRLRERLESSGATVMQATPATWRMLLEAGWRGDGRLKILCGGEALPRELADRLLACGGSLWNLYGPTETTIWSALSRVTGGDSAVPIGRPIANTQVYLLDARRQPVPVGVPGHLHIGGAGLARGYLRRPALTAERFVPDPFAREPGARLYQTGDLARYGAGGEIEYMGRLDQQVKHHGFRIELGEIEAALSAHASVREAVVAAREDGRGERRLVGYIVPADGAAAPGVSELRPFLKRTLPDYMVPSAFVTLDALPLTPNGKVDRRALPAPEGARPELREEYVPPATDVEKILAAIWAELLGVERVGLHDNFFELGGDSILGVQVVARANRKGLRLVPRHVFTHQTVGQLASVVGAAPVALAEQGLVTGEAPLTHTQLRFFEQEPDGAHHFNRAVVLGVSPDADALLLEQSLDRLLMHHDALRLRFERGAGGWRQSVGGPETNQVFSRFDPTGVSEAGREPEAAALAARLQDGLDLARGPLVRAALCEAAEGGPRRLLFVAHRLVADEASWRILLEDFQSCYRQLQAGGEATLPRKTTSFRHWAERLAEYAQSEEVGHELDFWLAEAARPSAPLPKDFPAGPGANDESSARTAAAVLEAEQTHALLHEVAQTFRARPADVLLAGLAEVYAEWAGGGLRLEVEGHGREEISTEIDVSRTVGWFSNLYPVTLPHRAGELPGELLREVKETLRQVPRGGLGYGLLRYLRRGGAADALRETAPPEMSFSYRGRVEHVAHDGGGGGPFIATGPATEQTTRPAADAGARRSHAVEVEAAVVGEELRVVWRYSAALHRPETIERLAERHLAALRRLIAHCLSERPGGYTPSDFPHAELGAQELDEVLKQIRLTGE